MKELKAQLLTIKELVSLCKLREVFQSKLYEGNFLGDDNLELFIKLKFELSLLGKSNTFQPVIDLTSLTKEIDALINISPNLKKSSSQKIEIKYDEENDLIINGNEITVGHEYACIISYIVQFYESTLLPKTEPLTSTKEIKKSKSIEYFNLQRESVNGIRYIKREETNHRNIYSNPPVPKEILKKRNEILYESLKENNFKWPKLIKAKRNLIKAEKGKPSINGHFVHDSKAMTDSSENNNNSNFSNGFITKGPLEYYSKFFSKFCSELIAFPDNDSTDLNKLKKDHSQLFEEMKSIHKNRKK